jgi:hypothetical protein
VKSRQPTTVEERAAVRGCRNCVCYDKAAGMCRLDNDPVTKIPADWCSSWKWFVNPQVTWTSAFAGLELKPNPIGRPVLPLSQNGLWEEI